MIKYIESCKKQFKKVWKQLPQLVDILLDFSCFWFSPILSWIASRYKKLPGLINMRHAYLIITCDWLIFVHCSSRLQPMYAMWRNITFLLSWHFPFALLNFLWITYLVSLFLVLISLILKFKYKMFYLVV